MWFMEHVTYGILCKGSTAVEPLYNGHFETQNSRLYYRGFPLSEPEVRDHVWSQICWDKNLYRYCGGFFFIVSFQ